MRMLGRDKGAESDRLTLVQHSQQIDRSQSGSEPVNGQASHDNGRSGSMDQCSDARGCGWTSASDFFATEFG
jgi:hypothetical protein